ncbi:type II secretion system protein [Patescibacteria group bacterium]
MYTISEILKRNKGKKNAFTMIELLVVVAIIGILIAAIVIAFVSARQKSRDARRKTDMKNIQIALQLYADDHDGKYPSGLYGTGADNGLTYGGYMNAVSHDPSGGNYAYGRNGNRKEYIIGARLENTKDSALDDDADGIIFGVDVNDPVYGVQ